MKAAILVITIASLLGCGPVEPQGPDQCMRRELFQACMKSLPAGPVATQYNDWAEVVDECDGTSYRQSIRKESQIKLECRP